MARRIPGRSSLTVAAGATKREYGPRQPDVGPGARCRLPTDNSVARDNASHFGCCLQGRAERLGTSCAWASAEPPGRVPNLDLELDLVLVLDDSACAPRIVTKNTAEVSHAIAFCLRDALKPGSRSRTRSRTRSWTRSSWRPGSEVGLSLPHSFFTASGCSL
jgi:hypothetical protein